MRFTEANKYFDSLLESVDNKELSERDILAQKLNNIAKSSKGTSFNVDVIAKKFQDAIEEVYSDRYWWEVVGLDIRANLYLTHDASLTAENILNKLIDVAQSSIVTEEVECLEEGFETTLGKIGAKIDKGSSKLADKAISAASNLVDKAKTTLTSIQRQRDYNKQAQAAKEAPEQTSQQDTPTDASSQPNDKQKKPLKVTPRKSSKKPNSNPKVLSKRRYTDSQLEDMASRILKVANHPAYVDLRNTYAKSGRQDAISNIVADLRTPEGRQRLKQYLPIDEKTSPDGQEDILKVLSEINSISNK